MCASHSDMVTLRHNLDKVLGELPAKPITPGDPEAEERRQGKLTWVKQIWKKKTMVDKKAKQINIEMLVVIKIEQFASSGTRKRKCQMIDGQRLYL